MNKYPLFLLCLLIYNFAVAQNLQKFEPAEGRILHGLGQFTSDYPQAENWQQVSEYQQAAGQVPVIYSVYRLSIPFTLLLILYSMPPTPQILLISLKTMASPMCC